jgi:hypothetical protein
MREPAIFGWILVTLLSYRLLAERLRQRKLRRAKRQGATAALDADPVPARTR